MSYPANVDVILGAANSGLTLTAALFDNAGVSAAGLVTTTMFEKVAGTGHYYWSGTIPDAHRGYIAWSSGATFKAAFAVNPYEMESVLLSPTLKLSTNSDNTVVTRAHDSMKLHQAVAQGPGSGANTIQLNASASAVDDFYNGATLGIYGGTGAFQANLVIVDYVGATREATLERNWVVAPDNTSTAVIHGQIGPPLVPNDPAGVTTLLGRLTIGRATLLDNLTGATLGAINTAAVAAQGAAAAIVAVLTGISSLAQWLGLIAGKQVGNTTARTEIRATGAGSGTYSETTDSQEAIRDRGDAAWTTGSGGGGGGTVVVSAAQARALADVDARQGTLTLRQGDTWTQPVIGLGTLDAARTALYFTVKRNGSDLDSASIIQIKETTGLLYIDGVAATAGQGSLTVNDATNGTVTLVLAAAATAQLDPGVRYRYDFQIVTPAGVVTLATGAFHVLSDVTLATS